MRISDWSSDVCSSDLVVVLAAEAGRVEVVAERSSHAPHLVGRDLLALARAAEHDAAVGLSPDDRTPDGGADRRVVDRLCGVGAEVDHLVTGPLARSEEHKSEVQSLMRISYAVLCLKKKKQTHTDIHKQIQISNANIVNVFTHSK